MIVNLNLQQSWLHHTIILTLTWPPLSNMSKIKVTASPFNSMLKHHKCIYAQLYTHSHPQSWRHSEKENMRFFLPRLLILEVGWVVKSVDKLLK